MGVGVFEQRGDRGILGPPQHRRDEVAELVGDEDPVDSGGLDCACLLGDGRGGQVAIAPEADRGLHGLTGHSVRIACPTERPIVKSCFGVVNGRARQCCVMSQVTEHLSLSPAAVALALGLPADAVRDLEITPLAAASAAGELSRVTLDAGPAAPSSLIAKARGTTEVQRAMDAALGLFARERRVYTEIAPGLPVASPRCWATDDFLLLEDLSALRAGDQARGMSAQDAERLVDALAAMHAAHWGAPPAGDW